MKSIGQVRAELRGDGHESCSQTNVEGKSFNAGRSPDRRLGCCQLRAPYSRVWLLIPRSLSILAMAFSLSAFRSAYL